jgi:ABC-type transporter Mla subunit MlaD
MDDLSKLAQEAMQEMSENDERIAQAIAGLAKISDNHAAALQQLQAVVGAQERAIQELRSQMKRLIELMSARGL